MSLSRSEQARINGAKSRGPKSEEGKLRSSQNACKHGLATEKMFVLDNESRELFNQFVENIAERYQPADNLERELVLETAHARWRLRRLWSIETAMFDKEMAEQRAEFEKKYTQYDEPLRQACAFEALAEDRRGLSLLSRYETRLRRAYERAVENLEKAQQQRVEREHKNLQNKPKDPAPVVDFLHPYTPPHAQTPPPALNRDQEGAEFHSHAETTYISPVFNDAAPQNGPDSTPRVLTS